MNRIRNTLVAAVVAGPLFTLSSPARPDLVWQGAPGESFGAAVAGIGDLDADGLGDVAIGSPHSTELGSARVYSGSDGHELFACSHAPAGSSLGGSLAALGDLDGDEVSDLAVGSLPAVGESGWAVLFSGRDGSTLTALRLPARLSGLGSAVSAAGDVDGDGIPDLAVAAVDAKTGAGTELLYSGSNANLIVVRETGGGDARAPEPELSVGDLDGDGHDEIVAVRKASSEPETLGAVRILFSTPRPATEPR